MITVLLFIVFEFWFQSMILWWSDDFSIWVLSSKIFIIDYIYIVLLEFTANKCSFMPYPLVDLICFFRNLYHFSILLFFFLFNIVGFDWFRWMY